MSASMYSKKTTQPVLKPGIIFLFMVFGLFVGLTNSFPSIAAAEEENPIHSWLTETKWTGNFDGMVERREIRVLVVYSKTFFFLDKGRKRGITHDAMKEFEKFVNKKLDTKTLKVRVVFIPVRRDQLLQKLVDGYGDIAAANLTITPERLKLVDFSAPGAKGVKEVVVTGANVKPMESYDDLEGREVYVRKSSSYYESLVTINNLFKKTGRKPMKLVAVDEAFEDEDLLEMLNAGLISTMVMDSHKANFWVKIFDNIQVHSDAYVRSDGEIAWAIRKNSPKLKTVVDEFISKHKQGTLIGNILINRYLKSVKYVKNSATQEEMDKFMSMVELFKKYAGQYGFDFLLLGAQAYQESGLDQSKKSPAGAIGVMQLLPSTAKDPNVGIPDIHILEKNIHAGAKYLRFIADRYYKDEAFDPVNRMLFSFAAYNAGPAKIQRVRNRAKEMGLDPYIWFQNTEVAAAEILGRETVQYVGNIYKYYIAYKLVQQQTQEKQKKSKNPAK